MLDTSVKSIFYIAVLDQNNKTFLSTSRLIRAFYTIRATIFEKVFCLEKFPKTDYFLAALYCSLLECNALIAIPRTAGLQAGH